MACRTDRMHSLWNTNIEKQRFAVFLFLTKAWSDHIMIIIKQATRIETVGRFSAPLLRSITTVPLEPRNLGDDHCAGEKQVCQV
jgi:hypothetical protein